MVNPPASEATEFDFAAFNTRLIQLPATFDYNSLEASCMESYTLLTRTAEEPAEDGIVSPGAKPHTYVTDLSGAVRGFTTQDLAQKIADATAYHILRRQYGAEDDLITDLAGTKDRLGKSLVQECVESLAPNASAGAIRKRLDVFAGNITVGRVHQLVESLIADYDGELMSRMMRDELRDDYAAVLKGMDTLRIHYRLRTDREFHNLLVADLKTGQAKGLQELKLTYADLVQDARKSS